VNDAVILAGRWATLQGDRCTFFVVQVGVGGYVTWCASPCDRAVAFFRTPMDAIAAGLRRAS